MPGRAPGVLLFGRLTGSELAAHPLVERIEPAAADQNTRPTVRMSSEYSAPPLRPEEALLRGELHAEDHEDHEEERRNAREQPKHEADAANELGQIV